MRRRCAASGPSAIPAHILEMQPDRYRAAAAAYLERHPDDTFWAAMAVWRAFLAERQIWLRQHGISHRVDGRSRFGTPLPPTKWVRETFGTPEARWPA